MSRSATMPATRTQNVEAHEKIVIEGLRVNNLKNIDVEIPLGCLTVVTGVSGSGKSSLAFDALHAEGQRRYIESFSPYARQFLDQVDKPEADRFDNLPPAVALRQDATAGGRRATIASATEIDEYLQLLFARAAILVDPVTGMTCQPETAETAARFLDAVPAGTRVLVAFPAAALPAAMESERPTFAARLADDILERGFTRVVHNHSLMRLGQGAAAEPLDRTARVIVDRIASGKVAAARLLETLEIAFSQGAGQCLLLMDTTDRCLDRTGNTLEIDGTTWTEFSFDRVPRHSETGEPFALPTPALFNPRSAVGACPQCQGFGSVPGIAWHKVVPDRRKSLREGAIAPWTTPAYRHELDELLALADDYHLPVDIPYSDLTPEQTSLIQQGVKQRRFGGLNGFFRWLERKRYKIGVAAFLSRYRQYDRCPACQGTRLRPESLYYQIDGVNIAELRALSITDCLQKMAMRILPGWGAAAHDSPVTRTLLPEIMTRLTTLSELGLGYLTLDRPSRTLSGGETRRVALAAAVGANLINMLYVLDEPSAGLHPSDRVGVLRLLGKLRDAPNTLVVVEHDPEFIRLADQVVDLGPGAGRAGGQVIYAGPPEKLANVAESRTGQWLHDAPVQLPYARRSHVDQLARLALSHCTRHNLQDLTVQFPLNCLCVVSGVSGSGKSSLVIETLYPSLCRALDCDCSLEQFDTAAVLANYEDLQEVVLIDASPVGRTSRSNPVTYLKVFDAIREAFAAIPEAQVRNFGPGTFSFNSDRGGRCAHCQGAGRVTVDMQFLPEISVVCPECEGKRFRRDVLEIKLRGKSIADVLEMTTADAFGFFRGHAKIQRRLAVLKEVGLDYLPLGQPATTLSGGESQRLKIAARLQERAGKKTMFLFEEPTTGLHRADVARLLECFGRLVAMGHSLVVIEHHLDVLAAADWILELGPGAGPEGGRLIAAGPPETVISVAESSTAPYLRERLDRIQKTGQAD